MKNDSTSGQIKAVHTTEIYEGEGITFRLCEYLRLKGSRNILSASNIDAANKAGMRLKFIKVLLENNSVVMEPGLLHYMKGRLEIGSRSSEGGRGISGFLKSKFKSSLTGESSSLTQVDGSGEVWLEPTFGHYFAAELTGDDLVADNGTFVAGSQGVKVSAMMQKNVSSALFGGEALFQTKVSGSGLAFFNSPVHADELVRIDLENEKLHVDGNFALLRTAGIDFKAEKSSKSLYSTVKSGEGILQTFSGTGRVWLAPTEAVYDGLENLHYSENLNKKGKSGSSGNAAGI